MFVLQSELSGYTLNRKD